MLTILNYASMKILTFYILLNVVIIVECQYYKCFLLKPQPFIQKYTFIVLYKIQNTVYEQI